MKPEEALKNIGDWISEETKQRKYDKATVIELSDSLITVKDAVNKQVPKKPQFESYGYSGGELVYDEWFCPKCGEGYEIDSHYYNYCPECGQKIDRGDIE